jgi:hypothetical protein
VFPPNLCDSQGLSNSDLNRQVNHTNKNDSGIERFVVGRNGTNKWVWHKRISM